MFEAVQDSTTLTDYVVPLILHEPFPQINLIVECSANSCTEDATNFTFHVATYPALTSMYQGAATADALSLSESIAAFSTVGAGPEFLDTADFLAAISAPAMSGSADLGTAVSVNLGHLLVGDPGYNGDTGRVLAFRFNAGAGTWEEMPALQYSRHIMGDRFGACVAIDDNLAVIGAPGTSNGLQTSAGAVHVFRLIGEKWVEQQTLKSNFPTTDERFGTTCGLSQRLLVAGGYAKKAYLFEATSEISIWAPARVLYFYYGAGSIEANPTAVATDGTYVAATAHDRSAVELWDNEAGDGWQNSATFEPDALSSDEFGASLSLARGLLALADPGRDADAGQVSLFSRQTASSEWLLVRNFTGAASARVGEAIFTDGKRVTMTTAAHTVCAYSDEKFASVVEAEYGGYDSNPPSVNIVSTFRYLEDDVANNAFTIAAGPTGGYSVGLETGSGLGVVAIDASSHSGNIDILLASYPADMATNPLSFEVTPALPAGAVFTTSAVPVLAFNHTVAAAVNLNGFKIDNPKVTEISEDTGLPVDVDYNPHVGESFEFSIYGLYQTATITNTEHLFYVRSVGNEPELATEFDPTSGEYKVTPNPARWSSDTELLELCLSNFVTYHHSAGEYFCASPPVSGQFLYDLPLYVYVFPTGSMPEDDTVRFNLGFVNEYFVPVIEHISSVSILGVDAEQLDDTPQGVWTIEIPGTIGTEKMVLEVVYYFTENGRDPTEAQTQEITLTISRHEFVPTLTAGSETTAFIRLFDQDGELITDGRVVEVIWNGNRLGEANFQCPTGQTCS